MKKLLLLVGLMIAVPVFHSGCATTGRTQVVQAQTLKSVGQLAEAAVSTTALLYRDGKVTADQAREVNDFFDKTFQPSFRLALAAVKGDANAVASADVVALAGQLTAIVARISK